MRHSLNDVRGSLLTIALAALCCALPIVIIAGVSIGGGILLGKAAVILAGLGGIGYVSYRLIRRRRAVREDSVSRVQRRENR